MTPSSPRVQRRAARFGWALRPENLFAILALLIGGGLCFLIPPGAGFDEITHLARVWEISGGYPLPNQKFSQGPYLPMAFSEVSYRNRFFNTPLESDYFSRNADKKIDWNNFTDHTTRSVYFPLSYLPQAVIAGLLGRVLDAPVLWIYYLCRLLELLAYGLGVYLAIRLMPFGKWLLAALALAPMALFQAGTISTDPYTNAASFLYIAWVLALAMQDRPVTWKQVWLTLGITGLLFAAKPNTAFLVLLMLLLPWRSLPKRAGLVLVAGTLALFGLIVVGWNVLVYSHFYANQPGYGVSGQIGYILAHPLQFLQTFVYDLGVHGPTYLREWIGVYAYNTGRVPDAVYPIFALLLLALFLLDAVPQPLTRRTRIVLALAFLAGYAFTVASLYLTTNKIGSPFIEGVQGRYFTIVAPLLLLALLPSRAWLTAHARIKTRLPRWINRVSPALVLAAGSLIVLLLYAGGVYASYYVTCGTSYYTPGLCYQPPYKNWDPNAQFTPHVTKSMTLTQSFTAVCSPLKSVRVWVDGPLTAAGKTNTYTLRDAATRAVLAQQTRYNGDAPNRAWREITFPAIEGATGRSFELEITASDIAPVGGLEYGVSARREYTSGEFKINGQPQPADLLFQYGCDVP